MIFIFFKHDKATVQTQTMYLHVQLRPFNTILARCTIGALEHRDFVWSSKEVTIFFRKGKKNADDNAIASVVVILVEHQKKERKMWVRSFTVGGNAICNMQCNKMGKQKGKKKMLSQRIVVISLSHTFQIKSNQENWALL